MFTEPHLRFCVDVLGPERLIYAVDYPFVGNDGAVDFLLRADLPEAAGGHRPPKRRAADARAGVAALGGAGRGRFKVFR